VHRAPDTHFFLFGRCVSAEPAADFAALLALGFRSTLDAAEAALLLVTSLFLERAISLPLSLFTGREHFLVASL
jgi:hypothetical protein